MSMTSVKSGRVAIPAVAAAMLYAKRNNPPRDTRLEGGKAAEPSAAQPAAKAGTELEKSKRRGDIG